MKISLNLAWAILMFLSWLDQTELISVDYRYNKVRGPPSPPRAPPLPQYVKKWEQHRPTRGPPRPPRPIPIKSKPDYMSVPVGPPVSRPTPVPIRTYWKNTKVPSFQTQPENTFHSSPPITNPRDFDYHIQTNYIPNTHSIPIKQVGEKGPIHTIPAPNLSIADKPIIIEQIHAETKHKHFLQQQQQHNQQQQQKPVAQHQQIVIHQQQPNLRHQNLLANQYQVSESNEIKLFREQQQKFFPQEIFPNGPNNYQKHNQAGSKQTYQLLNSQPQLFENFDSSLTPQALIQQQPLVDYRAVFSQPQVFHQDQIPYANQQELISRQNGHLEYQPYNMEHAQNANHQSTFVNADYNLRANGSGGDLVFNVQGDQNLQYPREIYSVNEENVNKVEQNVQVSELDPNKSSKEFFTTLPNRQVAETLASLQAAGKINSNLNMMQLNQQTPLEIYVPDAHSHHQEEDISDIEQFEEGFGNQNNNSPPNNSEEESVNYQGKNNNVAFGSRIRPSQSQ